MATQTITEANFQDTINNASTTVVIDFWAEWCGPCKMLAPVLEEVSNRLEGKVAIYKLNTDENPQVAQDYQITSIPCCVVIKNGQEVHRIIGHKSADAFKQELTPYL